MRIYNGDCLKIMPLLPAESIDLVVTSPPYDNLRTYNGNWQFNFEGVANELKRLIKPGGVIVWVVSDATINGSETGTSFRQALYFKEIGLNLHDTMIYLKPSSGARGSILAYPQNCEYMFIISKGSPATVHLIKDRKLKTTECYFPKKRSNDKGRTKGNDVKKTLENGVRNNYWLYYTEPSGTNHPAPFPLSLAEDHIKSWSNEGDTVLDCFAGSFTTGVACQNLGRHFIGIEIDKEYYKIGKERMAMNKKLW